MRIEVGISAGELVDRMTILELKCTRLPAALSRVIKLDLDAVRALYARSLPDADWLRALTHVLREVNRELWDIEEALRECELRRDAAARADRSVQVGTHFLERGDARSLVKQLGAVVDGGIRRFVGEQRIGLVLGQEIP